MEAGHLQALLVFEVLSKCEVGLAEGSDEADMRVYTAIAMAQQLIHADPPTKRIQYKRLQEVSGDACIYNTECIIFSVFMGLTFTCHNIFETCHFQSK